MLLSNGSLNNQPIVVYDSGVGGLTIAQAIKAACPKESIHYIGDTKHMPYGSKTETQLQSYLTSIIQFCLRQNYKLIVIACNTASCVAEYFLLKKNIDIKVPVINVIDPIIEYIIATGPYKHIGLIGTQRTIQYGNYAARLLKATLKLSSLATPMLAPMVEDSFCGKIDLDILAMYLKQLDGQSIDLFIPACTHYIFLENAIKHFFWEQYKKAIPIINVPKLTTWTIKNVLKTHHLENNTDQTLPNCFMATKLTPAFQKAIQKLFDQKAILVNV